MKVSSAIGLRQDYMDQSNVSAKNGLKRPILPSFAADKGLAYFYDMRNIFRKSSSNPRLIQKYK